MPGSEDRAERRVITMFTTIVTQRFGREREHDERRRRRRTRPSTGTARIAAGPPLAITLGRDAGADDQADELRRLDAGGDEASGPLVEVEHLLVEQRRRATTKPMSDAARNGSEYQMRRRLSIFQTMRHASAKDGGASSVCDRLFGRAHAPAARTTPRIGSRSRNASTTKIERRDGEDDERPPPAERGRRGARR